MYASIINGIAVNVTSANAITENVTNINWGLFSANLRFLNFNEIKGISDTSNKLIPIAIIASI